MVYRFGDMTLEKTQDIFQGKVNDVIVCRDISNGGSRYYTVNIVHDKETAKKIMQLFHSDGEKRKNKFVRDFIWKDSYFMLFEYVPERLLDSFFSVSISTLHDCEQLCLKLIMECLTSGIPYPFLYLQLYQRQLHLASDQSIYLGYYVNLEDFSDKITQKECAALCAGIVYDLIGKMKTPNAASYKLLEKKLWKGSYQKFTDLYRDVQMASLPAAKEKITDKLKKRWIKKQDKVFKVAALLCILAGILAAAMIFSQAFFADVPFMKIFKNSFETIGTESLLQ